MNHHECIQKALMIALSSNKKQIISRKNASKNIRSSSPNRSIYIRYGS
ncbi:Uncharacterised protein [Sphingobacterium multivorum]|nr:Uncharacterised protein [Sphingobacterium multivorum]